MHVIEQYKAARNGLEVLDDIPRYALLGWEAIPKDDVERLKWTGVFLRRQSEGEPGYFMMRIRIPNGIATSAQIRAIAGITSDLGRGIADITTRQQLQTRWIRINDVPEALRRLHEVGLVTLQTGMDNIRNINGCPLAGLHDAELLDASPVVGDFTTLFVGDKRFTNLPRKFNVTITGCKLNCTHAETQDIALVPATKDDEAGFNVLVGGKVGSGGYTVASPLDAFVSPELAPDVCAAITLVFSDNGSREHRNKSRLAFLIEDWGIEQFRAAVEEYAGFSIDRAGTDERLEVHQDHLGISNQKQWDRRAVGMVVPTGRTNAEQLVELARLAEEYGSSEVRLTVTQNAIIPNVAAGRLDTLLQEPIMSVLRPDAPKHLRGLVTCTGNDYCNLAQINTKPRAWQIAEAVRDDMKRLLTVHWSGCQAGCGNHPVSDIGLMGKNVRVGDEVVEGADVFLGGSSGPGATPGLKILSDVPLDELEPIMRALAKYGDFDAIRERLSTTRPRTMLPVEPARVEQAAGPALIPGDELPTAKGKLVRVGDEDVAVFRCNGTAFAIQNTCPHAESALAEGTLDGEEVICGEHGYRFNLRTGACPTDPSLRAKVFSVTAVDGGFQIEDTKDPTQKEA